MKLIVGLGNPGEEYARTRHNTGYQFVDRIASDLGARFALDGAFRGALAFLTRENEKVILLKPITYMNLSGEAVANVVRYYKIALPDVLVVYDDMDLSPGEVRFRPDGTSAGHKGMQNIIDRLGTQDVKRLRIGIGRAVVPVIDYVLEPYASAELPLFEETFNRATDMLDDYLTGTFDALMSKYNRKERHE